MPSWNAVYELHRRCSLDMCFIGNTYEPRFMDAKGQLRYDAHVVTTWKFSKGIVNLFGSMDADRLSGVEMPNV